MSVTSKSLRKPPFKGRPAADLLRFVEECLLERSDVLEEVEAYQELTVFLLDMDSDCNPKLEVENPPTNTLGLTPEVMVEKMDLILEMIIKKFTSGISDGFYIGLLEVFENSVLKLYQPHYVQFITYFAASTSSSRASDFLSLLLNIVHDDKADSIGRREGIGFIGSFVCRATFLGWSHSARTAKYLVSFMHALDIAKSSSDRMLFVLTLQTVCYMICWECNRWKDQVLSPEMDWVWRSKKGLIAVLQKTKHDGVLRLVSHSILTMLYPLSGRISVQLREFVGTALGSYKQLLPPLWKSLGDSNLVKPNFPFDPFQNLSRTCPLILPLIREWEAPGEAPDAPDSVNRVNVTSEESSWEENVSGECGNKNFDEDVWSFRPIKAALGAASPLLEPTEDMLMCSPIFEPVAADCDSMQCVDIGGNLVLSRIVSLSKFSPAPK